jgi:myo-inositol-1(or 4)-monophosphatase
MATLDDKLPTLPQLADLVEEAARQEIAPRFGHVAAGKKGDGSLLTDADLGTQRRLVNALATLTPDIPVLGEEMPAEVQAKHLADGETGFWCLDPLDGTGNFVAGIPVFAVSLALVRAGGTVLGVVHDPVRGETFTAARGHGAWLDGVPLEPVGVPESLADASGLVDFKRLPAALATALATRPPYRSQRSFGSVALDWCWLAAGRCHVYLHGGQRLWDYAAGSLILAEAGGAGGLLDRYDADWVDAPSLVPRIGMAAGSDALLASWRAWIRTAIGE